MARRVYKNNYPKIKIILVDNTVEAIQAVSTNLADATIDLGPVIKNIISKYGISNIYFQGIAKINNEAKYFEKIGIRKDWPILRDILDKALNSLSYQERVMLNQKWFIDSFISKTDYDKQSIQSKIHSKILSSSGYTKIKYDEPKKYFFYTLTMQVTNGQRM